MNVRLPAPAILALGLPLASVHAADWPRFLGPTHDACSTETGLRHDFPDTGLPIVWELPHGRSHSAPVIAHGHLVFIHLVESEEVIQCHDPASGRLIWKHAYPVAAGASYGNPDAPRCGPVIDPSRDLVFTVGLAGDLLCLRLKSGELVWQRQLDADFGKAPFFFARGSCPLLWKDQLILNSGGRACVISLDPLTGKTRWEAPHEWQASYASPIPASFHGREVLLVFAGGMGNPPTGGLLILDPQDGTLRGSFPWRARIFTSVIAASPVVSGNGVFITEGYDRGGAFLDITPELTPKLRWESDAFACQFSTPVAHEGHLYGFTGTSDSGAELVCFEVATGAEKWRWGQPLEVMAGGRPSRALLGRGSLLRVDGAFLALGEQGTLAWLDLSPTRVTVRSATQLFSAPETFGTPTLSDGRLYVVQNAGESRLLCYDLRQNPSR